MSTTTVTVFPEIAELDLLVESARAQVGRAQAIHAKAGEATAALELATRELTANPSEPALAVFVDARARHQAMQAAVAALENSDALNSKAVINSALGTERAFALLASAWGKRLAALDGIQKGLLRSLADARQAVTMTGVTNPLLVESSRPVVEIRTLLTTVENHAAESRFGQKFCEARGVSHEKQDLGQLLDAVRRPLPATV